MHLAALEIYSATDISLMGMWCFNTAQVDYLFCIDRNLNEGIVEKPDSCNCLVDGVYCQ